MKKRRKRIGGSFRTEARQQIPATRAIEMEFEELAVYIRRAEKKALPIIKETKLDAAAAALLLALYTQMLVTGNPGLPPDNGIGMANRILTLWQAGYYTPGPGYPFSLSETLQALQQGAKVKGDYDASFQPFHPSKVDMPQGIGQVTAAIVKHPDTQLWQILMILFDGPLHFIGAYRVNSATLMTHL